MGAIVFYSPIGPAIVMQKKKNLKKKLKKKKEKK